MKSERGELPPGHMLHVRVTNVPGGPAPQDIRQLWVSVEFYAVWAPKTLPAYDPTTQIYTFSGPSLVVNREQAMLQLKESVTQVDRYVKAMIWYRDHFPMNDPFFIFRASEVEILATVFSPIAKRRLFSKLNNLPTWRVSGESNN